MIAKSRKLAPVVENHDKWVQLHDRLVPILDEKINNIKLDLQKVKQDAMNQIDEAQKQQKAQFDDMMWKIKNLAQKIDKDIDEQSKRLEELEQRFLNQGESGTGQIPDGELLFIKKEICRYRSSLNAAKSLKDEILNKA